MTETLKNTPQQRIEAIASKVSFGKLENSDEYKSAEGLRNLSKLIFSENPFTRNELPAEPSQDLKELNDKYPLSFTKKDGVLETTIQINEDLDKADTIKVQVENSNGEIETQELKVHARMWKINTNVSPATSDNYYLASDGNWYKRSFEGFTQNDKKDLRTWKRKESTGQVAKLNQNEKDREISQYLNNIAALPNAPASHVGTKAT